MYKLFILILLNTLICQTLYSQHLVSKVITQKGSVKLKEEFQVLETDQTVKHGYYRKYQYKRLIESGYYKSNLRDSVWNFYNEDKKLIAQGNYRSDTRVGVWEFYSNNMILVHKYDYDKDSLIYFDVQEESKFGHAPTLFPDTAREQMPIFIGGTCWMFAFIQNNMLYPKEAWHKVKSAKVKVKFIVDKEGKVTEAVSISNTGDGFDEEAIRLVNLMSGEWIPGIQDGKKVQVQFILPFSFDFK